MQKESSREAAIRKTVGISYETGFKQQLLLLNLLGMRGIRKAEKHVEYARSDREAADAMSLAAYLGCSSIQDHAGRLERVKDVVRKNADVASCPSTVTPSAPAKQIQYT